MTTVGKGIDHILGFSVHLVREFIQIFLSKMHFSSLKNVLWLFGQSLMKKDIILIYSARNWEDILYKDEVLSLMKFLPQLRIRIYLTQVTSGEMPSSNLDQVQLRRGRLSKEDLYFNEFSPDECVAYLCGPPQMSENVSDWLNGRISEINFEKWWW